MSIVEQVKPASIRFPSQPRKDETSVARRRTWNSRCGRFRVVHSRIRFGVRLPRPKRLPDVYYAQCRVGATWQNISKHRKLGPAQASCAAQARALARTYP